MSEAINLNEWRVALTVKRLRRDLMFWKNEYFVAKPEKRAAMKAGVAKVLAVSPTPAERVKWELMKEVDYDLF